MSTQRMDLRQLIKVVVYSLLMVNFVLYAGDDIQAASHTMRNGGTFLDWTSSFATTIDVGAWIVLLLLFELETYILSDEIQQRRWVALTVHGIRLLCYVSLMHSVYAFSTIYFDITRVSAIFGISELCQLVDSDISFVRNLEYTQLTAENCITLSAAGQFYFTEPGLVVTDQAGLALETRLALLDVAEVIVWLCILLTIEAMVRLQDRSITRGTLVSAIKSFKFALYTFLWCTAAYWLSLGHVYFAWDEGLWIAGFMAIEMNMSDWKKEIEESEPAAAGN